MKNTLRWLQLGSLVLFGTFAAGPLGCAPEAPAPEAEPTGAASNGLVGDTCSDRLGECYIGCQGETPTPTEQCFTGCTCTFYGCINAPSPDCGATN